MKILLINSVCGIRSTGRIATELAEKYMSEGHECRIAYGRESVPETYRSITYRIGTTWGVRLNALRARIFDNEGFNAKKATAAFLKWADEYDPDLLWLHNLHGYYINVEMLFDWIKKRPHMKVRWTLHDCWAFTGHCVHFTVAKCDRWKTECHACKRKKSYPKSLFLNEAREHYHRKKQCFTGVAQMTIITPSHWLANLVRKSFLCEYPVEVVHNTINTEIFKPTPSDFRERYGLVDKKIVLGVATAWGASKGLYDFGKLAERLDDSYKIVLVGITSKQQRKMPKNILMLDRTNNARELAEIYTAADVFLNLTYEDTYPTVNLEAQACGTPCITYRTGGSVESVPPEHVVDVGDVRGTFEKITTMMLFKAKK